MEIQNLIKTLHKPVHPIVTASAVIGVVLLAAALLLTKFAGNNSSTRQPTIAYSTPTATLTPMPVDTSTWKTYTDWKFGYSVKLPQEFYSMVPGKGATGSNPDPNGSGEMDFENRNFRVPNNPYAFHVRINRDNHVDFNHKCTRDEDCFTILYNFYKPLPNTRVYLLRTRILNRDIRGLAIQTGLLSVKAGSIDDVYYEFTINGNPYELNIYDIGTYEQLKMKLPYIDAIASTISFSQ